MRLMTGRLAVMGFYVVSGYLITRVFEERYGTKYSGAVSFFINRLLRLYPLYLVMVALTWIAVNRAGAVPVEPGGPASWLPGHKAFNAWDLLLMPRFSEHWAWLGNHDLVPQAWSLDVEFAFYAMPLLLLLPFGRLFFLLCGAASFGLFLGLMYASESFGFYDDYVYKNTLATFWFFALGGLAYMARDRLRDRVAGLPVAAPLAGVVLFVGGLSTTRYLSDFLERAGEGWVALVIAFNVVTGLLAVLVILAAGDREDDLCRMLGELSYGIYLNHLLVGWGLMWISGLGGFHYFGRIGDTTFAVVALGVSVGFAWLTYRLVEMPVQSVRRLVRPSGARMPIPGPSAP